MKIWIQEIVDINVNFVHPSWGYGKLIMGCITKSWSKQCDYKGKIDVLSSLF
jgi:hypothetical protein